LGKAEVTATPTADGGTILESTEPLAPYPAQLGEHMRAWGSVRPDAVFLAERDAAGNWREVTYGQARSICDSISQALLDRGLGPERPVMLLSGNSVDHALLSFAAMQVGIPVAPVSPAYSLMSSDFAKVGLIAELVKPGLVYAASGAAFANVLAAVPLGGAELVLGADPLDGQSCTEFAELLSPTPGDAVEDAFNAVTGDDVAKYLFTSGSTGTPKGVINTQRMLCSNVQMLVQQFPYYMDVPPVMGSRSTYVGGSIGGYEGRVLQAGDILRVGIGAPVKKIRRLPDNALHHNIGWQQLIHRILQSWQRYTALCGQMCYLCHCMHTTIRTPTPMHLHTFLQDASRNALQL